MRGGARIRREQPVRHEAELSSGPARRYRLHHPNIYPHVTGILGTRPVGKAELARPCQQDQPQTVASLLGLTDGVRAKEFLRLVRRLRLIKEDDRKTIQDKLKTSGGATFTLVEKRNLFFGANYRLNESESLTALGPGGARRSADEIRRAASLTS